MLSITHVVATDGTSTTIIPIGEIDYDSLLPHLLAEAVHLPATVRLITWDMTAVPFMDVSGLHLILGQRESCRRADRVLAITGLQSQPRHLLETAQQLFPHSPWNDYLDDDQQVPAA